MRKRGIKTRKTKRKLYKRNNRVVHKSRKTKNRRRN